MKLNKAIPVEDLLDMWQQKMSYLNKINVSNQKNGKQINGIARINYDLAILLSKYDNYLAWKERKKIEKEYVINEHKNNNVIDYSKINTIQHSNNSKEINIEDILDGI